MTEEPLSPPQPAPVAAGRADVYYFALLTNFCLRISWTYKLSSHLRHNQRTVFIVRRGSRAPAPAPPRLHAPPCPCFVDVHLT